MNKWLKEKRWLVTIDLDGTLLMKYDGNNDRIAKGSIDVLKDVIKQGHAVAIITGRPYRDTKVIYEEIGLNTIIANYNGAYIHNPSDERFVPIQSTMNRLLIQDVLADRILKGFILNVIIEYQKLTAVLDKGDKVTMNTFHIYDTEELIEYKYGDKLIEDPFSVTVKIDVKKVNKYDVIYALKREYGNAFIFRIWEHGDIINIEINGKFSHKGSAMKAMAAYYGISMSKTIAFGDGLNDTEMLSMARLGVAMKNAPEIVKAFAGDITDYTNDESGVSKYLNKKFLNIKEK